MAKPRCLILGLAVQACVAIVRVERLEQITTGVASAPTSALQEIQVPVKHGQRWQLESFAAGATFGVLSCLLVLSFLMGCQVLQFSPSKEPEKFQAAPVPPEERLPRAAEPNEFGSAEGESLHLFWPRCRWLAGMLLVQSVSSFILARFENVVARHHQLIFFLTMLVGLGGNAGGQSVVLTCRKLALGEDVAVRQQLITGFWLGLVLTPVVFLRTLPSCELDVCFTVAAATWLIATLAPAIGTALPKLLRRIRADPGQSATMIQVIMDIMGIMITCSLGVLILGN